jgi:hypothetical protein
MEAFSDLSVMALSNEENGVPTNHLDANHVALGLGWLEGIAPGTTPPSAWAWVGLSKFYDLGLTFGLKAVLGANYVDGVRYDDPDGCVGAINLIPKHGETDVSATVAIKLHLVSYLNAEIE